MSLFFSPLSTALSGAVEGYALLDRASDRRRMLEIAQARVEEHRKAGRPRALVVVKSPDEMRHLLPQIPSDSAVVFVDCALERCNSEQDLLSCWKQIQRAAGATDEDASNIFVLRIQSWSSARLSLDPRVRWVIVKAPPNFVTKGKLEYRPYGRRSTLLADTRKASRMRAAAKLVKTNGSGTER